MNFELSRPRSRGRIVLLTVCFCVLAFVRLTGRAEAQADAEGQSAEYRELIEQALSEFKHKNWPEARVLFRRAHELSPNARTLRGMGVVSYEMRDYVNAVLLLSAALADARQPLTEAQRKECETLLGRSRTFVGTYALTLEPANAEVALDGGPLSRDADGRVLVPFGEHTLQAIAPGYEDSTTKLAVQGGEQGELRVVLYRRTQAAAAPVSSGDGRVERAAPTMAGPGPVHDAPPPTGMIGGGLRYSWVALGASAAFGAAWAGSWFAGQAKLNDLDSYCARAASSGTPCERGHTDTSSVQRFERLSNAMMGLTAGALVATGVLMTLEWPRERKHAARAPSDQRKHVAREQPGRWALGVGAGRLSLRGSF